MSAIKHGVGAASRSGANGATPGFWTLDRVGAALAGELVGALPAGPTPFRAVVTDTRALQGGELFVALRGERFDAHDFLADAVEGRRGALRRRDASRAAGLGVPVYVVRDTLVALGASRALAPCVGRTGRRRRRLERQDEHEGAAARRARRHAARCTRRRAT